MAEITRKVLQCDYPDCFEEESVQRITVTIGQRKLVIDLDPKHQAEVTIADVAKYAHKKPRSREVQVFDPADIPRTPARGRRK